MQQNSFIANLLSAQHVSDTIMPIIRSSRLYRWLRHVVHNTVKMENSARNMLSGQYVCNKTILLHPAGFFFPHINDGARSNSRHLMCFDNKKLYTVFFRTCCIFYILFSKNAVHFKISIFFNQIILTFSNTHALKFEYTPL